MAVELSIGDQIEIWKPRWQRLEALVEADPSQRQHDPAQPNKIMDPLLFSVAKTGDVDKFIEALEDHCAKERVSLPVLLERRSPSKNTLLHAAAESDDNLKAVIGFVPQHLIYSENSRGETPLHIAARAGKISAVEVLLRQEIIRYTDYCGNSALHEAVRNCHLRVILLLARREPNLLYCQNKESKSPLCVAVETRDLEALMLLLDGMDQRASEIRRISACHPFILPLYARKRMWEKQPWLFQLRDARERTPLHLTSYTNYLDGVKFLVEKFPTSPLEKDEAGYLPIHLACLKGHVKIVEELLQQWPDPAEFLTDLRKNIHVSAEWGSIATVKYMLKSPKFDHLINARDLHGNTPLHLAALGCEPSVVLLALDKRVELKLVNNNKMTARDVVEQDMKGADAPLGKKLTWLTLASAGTPRSGEIEIWKPPGRSSQKQSKLPELNENRDLSNTWAVVAALVASVTFTSGFSIPGGYNGSERNAGIPILIHKAMYNVFVTCNSIATYSSIVAPVIILGSYVNNPNLASSAFNLSSLPLLVSIAAMLLAFMAGVYVTITKLAWLSIFILFLGSVALIITSSVFILLYLPFGCCSPLILRLTHRIILVALWIGRE